MRISRIVFIAGVITTVFCACGSLEDRIDSPEILEEEKSDWKHTEKKKYRGIRR